MSGKRREGIKNPHAGHPHTEESKRRIRVCNLETAGYDVKGIADKCGIEEEEVRELLRSRRRK